MKKRNRIQKLVALAIAGGLVLTGCGERNVGTDGSSLTTDQTTDPVTSDTLYVEKVGNLPADFILGMDASCVPALEASGVKYYDHDGVEKNVYEILSENGINYIRVRVWNDPYDAAGNGYGGGNCDIENAVAIGKCATEYGMKLLVNFHQLPAGFDTQFAVKVFAVEFQCIFLDRQLFHDHIGGQALHIAIVKRLLFWGQIGKTRQKQLH